MANPTTRGRVIGTGRIPPGVAGRGRAIAPATGPRGPLGPPVRGRTVAAPDFTGLLAHLRNVGYQLAPGNALTDQAKSALADYLQVDKRHPIGAGITSALRGTKITGRRDPKAWNLVNSPGPAGPIGTPGPAVPAAPLAPQGPAGPAGPVVPEQAVIDFTGLEGAGGPQTQLIPEAWAQRGGQLFGPGLADKLAGLQFDPQIQGAGTLLARQPRDRAQALADIGSWYGQVQGQLGKARARDAAITEQGVESVGDLTARLVSSLGGQANLGSPMVAAAGQNAAGTLQALGASQEQFNSDLAPLLAAEGAAARTRQARISDTDRQNLEQQILGLQGQRGQARGAAQFDIQGRNNAIRNDQLQALLGIRQANNALAVQRANYDLALQQSKAAAASTGAKVLGALNPGPSASQRRPVWAKASVSQKNYAFGQALEAAKSLKAAGRTPQQIAQTLTQLYVAGYGWSPRKNPAVASDLRAAMTQAGVQF